MQYGRHLVGFFSWLVIGLLAGVAYNKLTTQPLLVSMTGTVQVDTATHEDSRLDNRAYLTGLVGLNALVYLTKADGAPNTGDPYRWVGKAVTVRGELVASDLPTTQPALELRVSHIAPRTPTQHLTPK